MDSCKPHTVVLAIDGLRAAALGAYGATAHSTPGIDQLTSEAVTYDWCYADSPDRLLTYVAISDRLFQCEKSFSNSMLVSDSSELLTHSFAKNFSVAKKISLDDCAHPAKTIGETQLAKAMAQFAEQLVSQVGSQPDSQEPIFAWLDLKGFYGQWDAPVELSESLLDEEDPRYEINTIAPYMVEHDVEEQAWCDARFAAVCRYAAQTMVLDTCVGSLVDLIEELFEGATYRLLLIGTRGYPLGEHGQIGGVDNRLYSEQLQVPLLMKSPDPSRRFTRIERQSKLSDALASELSVTATSEPREYGNSVLLSSTDGTLALKTNDWFLRLPSSASSDDIRLPQSEVAELYLKPDDRWEQNDVASLKPDVIDAMLAVVRNSSS